MIFLFPRCQRPHPDELVVGGAFFPEIDEDGVVVQGLEVAPLDVGGVDELATVGHIHVLVVVHALFDEEVGFPILVRLVVFQLGLGLDLPVGDGPEHIDIAVGEGEVALEGEVGVDVVFGVGVLHVAVTVEAVAFHGAAALVGAEGARVVLQHVGLVLVVYIRDAHDAVGVGLQGADVEGAELRAAGERVASVVVVEAEPARMARAVGEPVDGIIPAPVLLDGGVHRHDRVADGVAARVDGEIHLLLGEAVADIGGGVHVSLDSDGLGLHHHEAAREHGIVGRLVIDKENVIARAGDFHVGGGELQAVVDVVRHGVERVVVLFDHIFHETVDVLDGVHVGDLPVVGAVDEGVLEVSALLLEVVEAQRERVPVARAELDDRFAVQLPDGLQGDAGDAIHIDFVLHHNMV